jgi:hypothetical protein
LNKALAELAKRPPVFSVDKFCFGAQRAMIQDPSKFKTGVCSRRSGKTVACAADLVDTAIKHPATISLYITLSRLNAKRIIWGELLEINRVYGLGAHANETELCLTFPNRSKIYLSGAKDKQEVEKFRGLAIKKAYIDESQAFRSYLQTLIDEVLAKALFDHDGTLVLLGTPGPVPTGYFYEASQSPTWSHHGWAMADNPFLEAKSGKTAQQLIEADCKRMGVTLDDPRIQRECFGRWTTDLNSLVFRWSDANHYAQLPEARRWSYVLGVDVGYSDADAIAVLGWCDKGPEAYLIEEVVKTKQGVTDLAVQIEALYKKYDPVAVVMDTGGLGKKIAEEITKRYGLPIKAAEKARKYEYIELTNDALRTQRLFAKKESQFAQDCFLLEWDRDKTSGDRLVVSDAFHSDICDALLYAFREAQHWLFEPERTQPKAGTPEWQERLNEAMWERVSRGIGHDDEDPATWEQPQMEWVS